MNRKFENLFKSFAFEREFRPALHIEWEDVTDYASQLLSGIFDREIHAESARSDYYYWSLVIYKSPITKEELEKLNDLVEADDYDREIQLYDDFPVTEICQGLSCKLISKLSPFDVFTSFADDEGIWLVGDMTDATGLKNVAENTL